MVNDTQIVFALRSRKNFFPKINTTRLEQKKKIFIFCVGHYSVDVTFAFFEITNCARFGYGEKLLEILGLSMGGAACVLAVSISSFSEAVSEGE